MAGGSIFPAIIRPQYDPSAGFPKMVQDAQSSAGQIKQIFDTSFADIGKLAKSALTLPRNTNGSLNLPIEEYRKAARESDNYAKALRDIATAADAARKSQSDNSAATAAYVAGARAAATEEEKRAVGLREQIGLYQKLQTELARVNTAQAARPDFRSGAQKLLAGDTSVDQAAIAGASLQSVMGRIAGMSGKASGELAKVKAEANAVSAEFSALRAQATNAAEAGRLLSTIYAGTGEQFGRTAKSARESANVFEQAFAEQERAAKEFAANLEAANQRAAAAAKIFARDLELVKRAIDPTRIAQQQLDQELARADVAFAKGSIDAREYGLAVNAAANNFERATVGGTNFGNTARQMSSHLGNLRIATLQAGQQIQDIGISLYSGQRAGVVFAQQLPQLAFALSYLEGSANKTHDRIGRFATFLSGPWGLAVGLGVGVLVQLVASLVSAGDESDKTGSAVSRLKDRIDLSKNSYESLIDVVNEYNKAQERTEAVTLAAAAAAEKQAISLLAVARAHILDLEASPIVDAPGAVLGKELALNSAQSRIGTLQQNLRDAEKAVTDIQIKGLLDPVVAAKQAAEAKLVILEEQQHKGIISQAKYAADSLAIQKKLAADTEALNAAKRTGGRSDSTSLANNVGSMTALIKQLFGPGTVVQPNSAHSRLTSSGRVSDHYGPNARALDFTPGGGMGKYSTAEVEQMLQDAGVNIRRNAGGTEQFFGPGRGPKGPNDTSHNNHFHVAWEGGVDPEKVAAAQEKAAQRAAEATARLAEYGRDAADKIASIKNNFDETPPAVARANDMLAKMSDLADDIEKKKPPNYEQLLADIQALGPVIRDSMNKPFDDLLKVSDQQRQVDELILAGHRDDAQVLQLQLGLEEKQAKLTPERLAQLREMVVQDRLRSRELEKQNENQQRQLSLIAQTKDNISHTFYDLFKGGGLDAIASGFSRQWDAMLQNMADSLTETLFGDFFRDRKFEVLGFDKVKDASTETAKNLDVLTEAVASAADALGNIPGQTPGAANDNAPGSPAEIVVYGQRSAAKEIKSALNAGLQSILGKQLYDKLGSAIPSALQGAAFGQIGGGLVGKAGLGSAIGGVLGQEAGKSLGSVVGKTLGKFLPGIGGIIGGVLGGLLGGLSAKTGSASVSNTGTTQGGNNAAAKAASSAVGTAVQSSISQIAEQLGGSIGDYGFTIGQRNDEFRVSGSTGSDVTSKNPSNLLYKGKDQGEAIRVALVNAIEDGAVKGIREGAKRLLLAGQDLNVQLAKALKFNAVFDDLNAIKDPLGQAIIVLNRQFTDLQNIFKEAGASTADYAALEELYGLKRTEIIKQQTEATKQANEALTSSLKDLISQLETGDNGLSLRDRLTNAHAAYDPLAEAIRGGQTVDYAKFTDAARSVIDITRQIYGSQQEYFNTFNDVLGLSKQALATAGANVTSINTSTLDASPFTASTAANDNSGLVSALGQLGLSIGGGSSLADLSAQLAALNNNMGTLIQLGLSNGSIVPSTNFAVANNF